MNEPPGFERHSEAEAAELIADPDERARREAANGLRQFDHVLELIEYSLDPERPFRLRLSTILGLNRIALEGIHPNAGGFRPAGVEIKGSKHEPPPNYLLPSLLEELCDYVNENWDGQSAIQLAAYVMWRINWIHPFADGNGRTSRALSYLILCVRLGYRLPGSLTIPELIADNKKPYYDALEAADVAFDNGAVDVSEMENLLDGLLAKQLMEIHRSATGAED